MSIGAMLQILATVVGGLGLFLLGMKNMSEGMQAVAGNRLRKLISSITGNRVIACAVGALVTCCIQSSSVTSVMVVGFVNSGFMTLTQAIGVIMGANIGTTITGWILVLKIGKFGLPLLGVAAFFFLFSRNEKLRFTAMLIMGVGMLFFGLELMAGGFKPLRDVPEFLDWFSAFRADSYLGVLKCAFAGCVLTAIVQSSSATLGITIGLAEAGIIPFPTAAALILGENIGTTITALLASIGSTTNARRAAVSHTIFNLIGVAWITAIFPFYLAIVEGMLGIPPGIEMTQAGGESGFPFMRAGIASIHSGFNIVNTLLFLPLLPLLAKVVTRLVKDKPQKETPHLTYLDVRILDTPAISIQQSFVEIMKMGKHVEKMFHYVRDILESPGENEALERKAFHREEVLDIVQKEIFEFLGRLLSGIVPREVVEAGRQHVRMADEYESISDYLAAILKLRLKMRNAGMKMSESGAEEIMSLHDRVCGYVCMINDAVNHNNREILSKARTQGRAIRLLIKEYRDNHLQRVQEKACTPLNSLIFSDLLTSYRRIEDHALNIAETIAGEK